MKKNNIIRGAFAFAIAATAIVGLTACGDKKGCKDETNLVVDASKDVPVKTELLLYVDGEDYAKALKEAFEKKYKNYILTTAQVGATDSRARVQLEQQDGPDTFVFPHDHVGLALQQNLLQQAPTDVATNLTSTLQSPTLATVQSCWDNTTNKTKKCEGTETALTFGAPLSAESNALFYNVTLVKNILNNKDDILNTAKTGFNYEAVKTKWTGWATALTDNNLDEIMTLNDILAVSAAYNVAEGTDTRYFYQADLDNFYHSYMYMTAFGYSLFGASGDDKTLHNFTSEACLASLNWVYDNMVKTKLYPSATAIVEGTYMDEFYKASGSETTAGTNAAIVVTGPWNSAALKEHYLVEKDGVSTYPDLGGCGMPKIEMADGTKNAEVTFSGIQVVGVNKSTKNAAAAWKLVEFMVSEDGGAVLYNETGKLPCLKDTSKIEGLADDKVLNAVSKQLQYSKGMPSIAEMGFMWTVGATMFTDLFAGVKTPEQCAEAAKTNYESQALK